MKINIIAYHQITETVDLVESIRTLGCEANFFSPRFSLANIGRREFWDPFCDCDLLYYRSGFGDAARTVFASQIENKSILTVNRAALINNLLSNKVFQSIHAQAAGLQVPRTLIGRHSYKALVTEFGSSFIVKAANGIQGSKVFLICSQYEYDHNLSTLSGDILCQEIIPNTGDYRVFVFDGMIHEIYKRIPKLGDFRANMSQGGSGQVVSDAIMRTKLSHMALVICRELKLDIVGIDIIEHKETGELYFIEANINPSWKGLDETLGTHTAKKIAEWFLRLGQGEKNLLLT